MKKILFTLAAICVFISTIFYPVAALDAEIPNIIMPSSLYSVDDDLFILQDYYWYNWEYYVRPIQLKPDTTYIFEREFCPELAYKPVSFTYTSTYTASWNMIFVSSDIDSESNIKTFEFTTDEIGLIYICIFYGNEIEQSQLDTIRSEFGTVTFTETNPTSFTMEEYLMSFIFGVGGGFGVGLVFSLIGFGIYKSLKLVERSA